MERRRKRGDVGEKIKRRMERGEGRSAGHKRFRGCGGRVRVAAPLSGTALRCFARCLVFSSRGLHLRERERCSKPMRRPASGSYGVRPVTSV